MKYSGLSLLRGVAAFGIVGCHLFLAPMTSTAFALLHFCDLNVAIFGAISGFLLLMSYERRSSWGLMKLVMHRAKRIFPTYFLWTVVYVIASFIMNVIVRHEPINARYYTLYFWFSVVFRGGSSTHLWYLAHLFWWSVLLYVLWNIQKKIFTNVVVLLSISIGTLYICLHIGGDFCNYGLRLLVFMALGAAQYKIMHIFEKIPKTWLTIIIIITLILHAVLPIKAYARDFIVVFFLLPLFVKINGEWCYSKFIDFISANSFGVYLVHPLLTMALSMVVKRMISGPTSAPILLIDWFLVCFMASVFTWILRHNKFTLWMVK